MGPQKPSEKLHHWLANITMLLLLCILLAEGKTAPQRASNKSRVSCHRWALGTPYRLADALTPAVSRIVDDRSSNGSGGAARMQQQKEEATQLESYTANIFLKRPC